jgi:uncharacterized membrane protein
MVTFLLWYVILSLLGWLAFPLVYHLFPNLADRGFTFCRTLGLLIWAYLFWLLASLQLLRNDLASLLLVILVLAFLGAWLGRRVGAIELAGWIRSHRRNILVVEALFLVSFALMTLVRAANPDIMGTEKPMELAFINAILRSPTFPPHDPWLSGYAISYYYFGYVMVAMLAKLTATPGGVAFNLGISTVFALSALGAYGMVYNLLAGHSKWRRTSLTLPLLGPLFILLVGNLEGFLEVLHAGGVFWRRSSTGEWVSGVWKWLDLVELTQPPVEPLGWAPRRFYWWWRASRVIQDYDLQGNLKEVINEFPAFSYLLADLHPHVLAMPFAFLAMALALQLYYNARQGLHQERQLLIPNRLLVWVGVLILSVSAILIWLAFTDLSVLYAVAGIIGIVIGGLILSSLIPVISQLGEKIFWSVDSGHSRVALPVFIDAKLTFFAALVLGGLAFLNTWDFPFYVVLVVAAFMAGQWQAFRHLADSDISSTFSFSKVLRQFIWYIFWLAAAGVLLYFPFYLGFASQAGGIIPNLIYPTRGAHLWIMFAPLFIPLICYLAYFYIRERLPFLKGLAYSFGIMLVLWLLSLLFALVILAIPQVGDLYLGSLGAPDTAELFRQALTRRLVNWGGWFTLGCFLGLAGYLLWFRLKKSAVDSQNGAEQIFALLLVLLGILLVLGPEFFFLRDQFGWRINTIFKFYYQAWLLLGVVAAYASAHLFNILTKRWLLVYQISLVVLLGVCLLYICFGVWERTHAFNPAAGWSLDGVSYLRQQNPDELAAIDWLAAAPAGVVAEAISYTGGSYSSYARVATISGQPAVLGWIGHESQWRGGGSEMGSRSADIESLYCSRHWGDAQLVIDRYNIRYVFVGALEYATYVPGQGACQSGLNEVKFRQNLEVAYQIGDVAIYAVP